MVNTRRCKKRIADDPGRVCMLPVKHEDSCFGGPKYVVIDYTNWKNRRAHRYIHPLRIYRGSNEWHPIEQWLLDAICFEDGKVKSFAMCNIHAWVEVESAK
jgi:hypothetical protein